MDMMMLDLPWYFVVLCLLAGAVYAGALYFVGPQRLSRRLRWLLAVLRAAAVALICFLLLGPTMKQKVHEKQKPHIVLAQDISASVKASADSTFDITTLADRLEDRCRVSVERFGSATHTDIGRVMEKYRDDNVAALVLATDGINNRGQNPASLSEKLLFPVYSVALGDTTPQRDAAIGNLRYNRIATLGNTFPVEIPVSATLLKGSRASLSIKTSKGQTIQSKELVYSDENFFTVIPLEIEAKQAGLQQYEALLTITDGEKNHSNNHTKFFIDVIDSRNKIALIGNAPHPDLAALKNAMEGNPNYEAQCRKGKTTGLQLQPCGAAQPALQHPYYNTWYRQHTTNIHHWCPDRPWTFQRPSHRTRDRSQKPWNERGNRYSKRSVHTLHP